jgi:Holliday junction resolvase-like predicted endonuclease
VHYWRERNHEVDFIVDAGRRLVAIEVKSGRTPLAHAGTAAFCAAFKPQRTLLDGATAWHSTIFWRNRSNIG